MDEIETKQIVHTAIMSQVTHINYNFFLVMLCLFIFTLFSGIRSKMIMEQIYLYVHQSEVYFTFNNIIIHAFYKFIEATQSQSQNNNSKQSSAWTKNDVRREILSVRMEIRCPCGKSAVRAEVRRTWEFPPSVWMAVACVDAWRPCEYIHRLRRCLSV